MKKKPRVLIFIDWYLPAYKAGGPVRSIANLVELLSDKIDFYVFTSNKDLGEEQALQGITANRWTEKNGAQVFYSDKVKIQLIKTSIENISPDYIYLNSLFSINYTIKPLRAIDKRKYPIILAPRGMLGKGALQLKKAKKAIFLNLAKSFGLYKNISWHATGEEEKKEIINCFHPSTEKIHVLPNVSSSLNKSTFQLNKNPDELKLIFYSRISKKKNLHFLTEILIKHFPNKNIQLEVWGTKEDVAYFNHIFNRVNEFVSKQTTEKGLKISYCGESNIEKLPEIMGKNHFFVLPTVHENFGHVIAEALGCSLPVIISNNTPWKKLPTENIGWDIDLKEEKKWVAIIKNCLEMDNESYQAKREAVQNYFTQHILKERQELMNKYNLLFQATDK